MRCSSVAARSPSIASDNPPSHPRALLAARGLRPKKRYGQNFLMDGAAARRIAQLALADAPSHTRVLEIGAGTGSLTRALLDEGAEVTALEVDPDLVAIVRERVDLANARIESADALAYDYAAYAAHGPWRVAGNLPYNIATPLLLRLIDMDDGPQSMTVMVQRDVADRLAARASTPAYGSLTIAVQYAMRVERAFTLGPRAFYPPPNVDSTVVRLVRRDEPVVALKDVGWFGKVVRAAFAYRRKTLANSLHLALALERATIAQALVQCHLAPECRGEQLEIHDFARLADALAAE